MQSLLFLQLDVLKGVKTTVTLHLEKGADCASKKLFLETGSCTNCGIEKKDAGIHELLGMAASFRFTSMATIQHLGLDRPGPCQTPLH